MGKIVCFGHQCFCQDLPSSFPVLISSAHLCKRHCVLGCSCRRGNFVSRDLFLCKLISIACKKHLLTSVKDKVFPEFSGHTPIRASCGTQVCVWSPHDRDTDLLPCSVYRKSAALSISPSLCLQCWTTQYTCMFFGYSTYRKTWKRFLMEKFPFFFGGGENSAAKSAVPLLRCLVETSGWAERTVHAARPQRGNLCFHKAVLLVMLPELCWWHHRWRPGMCWDGPLHGARLGWKALGVSAQGSSSVLFSTHPLCWPQAHLKLSQQGHIHVLLHLLRNVL